VSLDASKQKQLMGDQPTDSASSSTSISSMGHGGSSTLDRGGKTSRQMLATTRSASRGVESSGIYLLFHSNAVVNVSLSQTASV